MKRDSNIEKELDKAVTLMNEKFACSRSNYKYIEEADGYIFCTDLIQKNGCAPSYVLIVNGDDNRGCLRLDYSNDCKAAEQKRSKLLDVLDSKRYFVGLKQEEDNENVVSIIDFNAVYGDNLAEKIVDNLVGLVIASI